MYRQLYQMGGIGTLPMDYGQALQVPNQGQMPAPDLILQHKVLHQIHY
jgi:hypothetical protein